MNLIDLLDPDHDGFQARTFSEEREHRHGLTDSDDAVIAAALYIMPEESEHEGGSPLNFAPGMHSRDFFDWHWNSISNDRSIAAAIDQACRMGWK